MIDFKEKEKEIIDFWEKEDIFHKSVDKPSSKGNYLFYDGPPFASGAPHYGHLVGGIMKDVVPRFWTMKGYRVERKWGWDCHGLPIENIVEKELGSKQKKDIEKLGVDKFNDLCRFKVLTYVDEWEKIVKALGRWADMKNSYRTMDLEFMESVWYVFKELHDKGLIYEDYRSMHVCPRCETTLSQSEVAEGYKDIKDLSVTAKFELKDEENTFILSWTTTPWTLIGNVALAVGEDIDYIKLEKDNIKYIIAKELVENYKELEEYSVIEAFKGKDLIGKEYKPLFNYFYEQGNGWKIVSADFVTTEDGTGVVHIAPAFGEDDMNLGKEKDLPFVQHVGMDGYIINKVKDFKGLHVKPKDDVQSTDVAIIKYLAKENLLFAKKKYEHSYPHCWRCDTPLINYATSSYFVAVTKIKDRAIELAKDINWTPNHIKEGRFGKWLEGARDWSISRQRFWASVIPIWKCGKCDNEKVFGSVSDLEEVSNEKITDIHKHVVDKITFDCKCGGTMTRIPDVLDTWFDSGSMPYAQQHYPFENKEKFEKSFPAEFIAEGIDQTRAWFYYLHIISTGIKDSLAFKNVAVNGMVLAEDGKKMSKSLKNFPDPMDMVNKYGADALRMYLLTSPVVYGENFSFIEKDMQSTYRRFTGILQNVFNFYEMFKGEEKQSGEELPKLDNDLDKWIVSKFNILVQDVNTHMEEYNILKASRPIIEFIDILSTWYIRRSRDRFKEIDEQAIQTLAYILKQLSKLIAPFTPMTADIIYKSFESKEESVHLEKALETKKELIDNTVLENMYTVRQVAEVVHSLRAKESLRVRQPLAVLEVDNKSKLDESYLELLSSELNVEEVKLVDKLSEGDTWKLTEVNNFNVTLDIQLTEELKDKGNIRELIRFINSLRKQVGLKPSDNPVETYQTESKYLKDLIENNKEELIKGTSAKDLEEVKDSPEVNKECKVNKEEIILGLRI